MNKLTKYYFDLLDHWDLENEHVNVLRYPYVTQKNIEKIAKFLNFSSQIFQSQVSPAFEGIYYGSIVRSKKVFLCRYIKTSENVETKNVKDIFDILWGLKIIHIYKKTAFFGEFRKQKHNLDNYEYDIYEDGNTKYYHANDGYQTKFYADYRNFQDDTNYWNMIGERINNILKKYDINPTNIEKKSNNFQSAINILYVFDYYMGKYHEQFENCQDKINEIIEKTLNYIRQGDYSQYPDLLFSTVEPPENTNNAMIFRMRRPYSVSNVRELAPVNSPFLLQASGCLSFNELDAKLYTIMVGISEKIRKQAEQELQKLNANKN